MRPECGFDDSATGLDGFAITRLIGINPLDGVVDGIRRIGDADAPAIIAAAVYAGHKYARELDCDIDPDNPAKYDRVFFEESEILT